MSPILKSWGATDREWMYAMSIFVFCDTNRNSDSGLLMKLKNIIIFGKIEKKYNTDILRNRYRSDPEGVIS